MLSLELGDGDGDGDQAGRLAASPPMLSEEELLERLKQEFGAREIFEDDPPQPEE